uniref:SCP domain-containing protein n=1 Tax=Eptatretus burgeri TaxID=7764 RepID=A0A8C4PYA3_EPTBU
MSEFEQALQKAHNECRAMHGSPPLSLSLELSSEADAWAKKLVQEQQLRSGDTQNGENIFCLHGNEPFSITAQEVVDAWYKESSNYDYVISGFQPNTGNFTQIVWRASEQMGVGLAQGGNRLVVVVRYHPPGNIDTEKAFRENVLPSSAKKRKSGNTGQTKDEFEVEFLERHNELRARHGAAPLSLTPKLNTDAQEWADHLAKSGKLEHSNTIHGENLYWKTGSDATGKAAVDSWYSEIKDYNFQSPGYQPNTGHFTQVVWCDTLNVGVGKAFTKGQVFVVAQYDPPGNMIGGDSFERNVLPEFSKGSGSISSAVEALSLKGDNCHKTIAEEFVDSCNQLREKHNSNNLVLSEDLSCEAQAWAQEMVALGHMEIKECDFGQCLGKMTRPEGKKPKGEEIAQMWYSKKGNYDFSQPGFQKGSGNFTQLVWKASMEVGLGIASANECDFFVVAFFNPPGNITGKQNFADNVWPTND